MAKRKQSKRSGLWPLAYMGVAPVSPPGLATYNRAPTPNDRKNFNVGELWIDRSTAPVEGVWMLVSLNNRIARWLLLTSTGSLLTLTGNVGGAVSVDGARNINTIGGGPLIVTGNPATNTLTVDTDGTLAEQYPTDITSPAIPAAGVLEVFGADGLQTTAVANRITIGTDGTLSDQFDTDNLGPAIPVAGVLEVFGGAGLETTGAANRITIDLDGTVATSYPTDLGGPAIPVLGELEVFGGAGIQTTGAANRITIDADGTVPLSFPTDLLGPAIPALNEVEIIGMPGSNIETTGAGNIVNINLKNGLNDFAYSTGTFVPVLKFGGSSAGVTYASRKGFYTRFGNLCFIFIVITLTHDGTGVGTARIDGLPFAPGAGGTGTQDIYAVELDNIDFNGGYTAFHAWAVDHADGELTLIKTAPGAANAMMDNVDFHNDAYFKIQGAYYIDTPT